MSERDATPEEGSHTRTHGRLDLPLELPCDLSVNRALNFDQRSPDEWIGAGLGMMAVEQVLTDDGDLEVFPRPPGQSGIEGKILVHHVCSAGR